MITEVRLNFIFFNRAKALARLRAFAWGSFFSTAFSWLSAREWARVASRQDDDEDPPLHDDSIARLAFAKFASARSRRSRRPEVRTGMTINRSPRLAAAARAASTSS